MSPMRLAAVFTVLLSAELAAAVPVAFQFDSITNSPAPAVLSSAPILGSGDLEFDASGNLLSGQLSLSPYAIVFDVDGDGYYDVQFDTTSFMQTLAPAAMIAGAIDLAGGTGSASNSCTVLPAAPPGTACSGGSGMAFGADSSQSTSVATLVFTRFGSPTDVAGTITWVITATTGNVQTRAYSFATLPEPSEVTLLAVPLALAWYVARRRG